MEDLIDFPYSSNPRPFDWFLTEPPTPIIPTHYLSSKLEVEAYQDLKICLYIYMTHRKELYVNYMAGAKNLFAIFFPPDHPLKEMAEAWDSGITRLIGFRGPEDWPPAYEIQRLWLATKIHWSWLELAWFECEEKIWESEQVWMRKKLERKPLL